MKNVLAILSLLVCACTVPASERKTENLSLSVELTTGERSKDSSSETTTITLARNTIVWERTFGGRRGAALPSRKEFRLSPADKLNLLKLIRSNNLLVTDSIELPRDASTFRYFEISVDLAVGEKKGAISISGMRNAVMVKEKKLYQNTLTLVRELYRIMKSQDKNVRFEELILEPTRR